MNKFQALLQRSMPLMADGAMGTMLFQAGLQFGDPPEAWNVIHPDIVRSIHRGYLDAGSHILLTNTFGGNRFRLAEHDLYNRVAEINRSGVRLARKAADWLRHCPVSPDGGGDWPACAERLLA